MIEVDSLQFSYPGQSTLIDSLDLKIEAGTLFGLLGPNGAGKTTLIRLMTGLLVPQAGFISIGGMNYRSRRLEIQRISAVVPQNLAFYPQLTAEENLSFFCHLCCVPADSCKALVNKALELTGLDVHRATIAGNYSGGMKRRLNMAIGLLNRPKLLFLDEPTVGIDPQSRYFIQQAIQEINQTGATIIYTSHYLEEVEQLCDRIAIMDHGRILTQGTLSDLLDTSGVIHVQLKFNVTEYPLTERIQASLEKYKLNISDKKIGGVLPSPIIASELISLFEKEAIPITGFRYGRQTLESLFFDLTATRLRD
ncbi:MAG: ABC transporter ATP-binding protein [Candidatus Thiodiazotropha sp. (ex Rostrolucina anterorostrata)]|nr:ABC transporter ATP-binding protein [Candidatus Thiodiazotropha sp. (ex Rostrolucina anterorostrata)]